MHTVLYSFLDTYKLHHCQKFLQQPLKNSLIKTLTWKCFRQLLCSYGGVKSDTCFWKLGLLRIQHANNYECQYKFLQVIEVKSYESYTTCLKKVFHFYFHNNFGRYGPIFVIFFTIKFIKDLWRKTGLKLAPPLKSVATL